MDDVVKMKELKTNEDAANDEFGLGLFKSPPATHVIAQVSSN